MKTLLTFVCIYCGQHMECDPRFAGRQTWCPICLHRIVIPSWSGGEPPVHAALVRETRDSRVPMPKLEVPVRCFNRILVNAVLAQTV